MRGHPPRAGGARVVRAVGVDGRLQAERDPAHAIRRQQSVAGLL